MPNVINLRLQLDTRNVAYEPIDSVCALIAGRNHSRILG
jgi:hypothetical protein